MHRGRRPEEGPRARVQTILQVNVNVCVLLGVRTPPENENIYHL